MVTPGTYQLLDPDRPSWESDGPRPVRAYRWEPSQRQQTPPPVVLLSHGTGGSALDLAWLAEPLAEAGYLVAGVDHHGNNSVDGYLPEGFVFAWERPRDLAFLLRELERERDIGPVGTAGFSLGGFTAAAMVGARLAPDRLRAVVRGLVPVPPLPEFPDLLAALHTRVPDDMLERLLEQSGVDTSLPQVRAAFLICPAIGQLVDEESLAGIDRPVAIRWGGADDNAPGPENALRYGEFIPGADVRSAGEDVGHYAFANDDAADAPVRARVAADAVEFFTRHLPTGPQF